MPSSPSPPEEAEHIRHQKLTPESPKPVHYPSPSNIPILEKQMDPVFDESAPSHYPKQTPTPSANDSSAAQSYFAAHPHLHQPHQQPAPPYQNVGAHGSMGAAVPAAYPHPPATYIGGMGTQPQDTSMHNFSAQQQSPASSISDSKPAPGQDLHSAYPFSHDSLYAAAAAAAQQVQAPQASSNQFQAQANAIAAMAAAAQAGGAVDVQALLDTLSPPAINNASDRYAAANPASSHLTPQPSQAQANASASSLPAAPGLPPRPPAQEKPATHPNYNPNDDIRSYHPHSQKPTTATQLRGNGSLQSLPISPGGFAAGTAAPASARSGQSPTTPVYTQRQSGQRSETPDDEDIRWPPEINKLYEDFLDQERKFVTEGQWDQFPMGSRLFIGNLPTEKVTKRDIFHRFFRHGKLAQISIKQAYGFVQFLDSESCRRALDAEQGQAVRGRKMHLEVSKPQRNTKKAPETQTNDRNSGARRRSRSPDYTRGGTGSVSRNDRYSGNQNPLSPRDRDNRRFRDRDDYRPMRSPSPRGGPRGGRGRDRSRDRYDTRWRSRSRSPRRYRSPSPRRDFDDDLGLPRRAPHEVPDVQILVINEELPRDFIRWVEDTFRSQGLRINVLIMSARLSEEAVVRRQILEGVLAIVRLDTTTLVKSKVNVQIFDRRGGANNVQFNEYADLDPGTAAALVNNAKQTHSAGQVQPPTPSYGYNQTVPSLSRPPSNQYTPMTAGTPNISSLISSLDPGSLSQLLGAMAGNNAAQTPQPTPPGIHPDLARLIASVSAPSNAPAYRAPAQAPQSIADQFPALASLLAGATQQQGQQIAPPVQTPTQATAPPDMNEIMAQLAKYNPNQR